MELPSPLIERFLPAGIVRGLTSAQAIRRENFVIELQCFHAGMCTYFDRRLQGSNMPLELRTQMDGFLVKGEGLFEKLHFVERPVMHGMNNVSSLSKEAVALMQDVGLKCSIKTLYPFTGARRRLATSSWRWRRASSACIVG